MELVKLLPIHRCSVDIFSYSGPSGILGSGGKQNTAQANARGRENCCTLSISSHEPRVGISGTTAKSRIRKFVPSSHPGPFAVVATSRKSQTKVGTLAYFDLL